MHLEIHILRTTLITYTCSVFQYALHRNGHTLHEDRITFSAVNRMPLHGIP